MKKYLLYIFSSFIAILFLSSMIGYQRDINISTFKSKGTVTLVITGKNIDQIEEVTILRGSDLGEAMRQVKTLSAAELNILKTAPVKWVDKFPLPGNSPAYYRAVVTYKEGVQRYFPATDMKVDSTLFK